MRDFTYKTYELLLRTILKKGYKIYTVQEYLENASKRRVVILRHDVDRSLNNALDLAKIEYKLGIRSTYYFRTSTFKLSVVKEIAKMGHEIGYHYETLFKAKGNYEKAIIIFENELKYMRKYFQIKTICAHGNIFMKGINYDLWKKYDFKRYDIIGEAYLSLAKKSDTIISLSDTGRRWNLFNNTFKLINNLNKNTKNYYLLVHPDKWSNNWFLWAKLLFLQSFRNIIKKIIIFAKNYIIQ